MNIKLGSKYFNTLLKKNNTGFKQKQYLPTEEAICTNICALFIQMLDDVIRFHYIFKMAETVKAILKSLHLDNFLSVYLILIKFA